MKTIFVYLCRLILFPVANLFTKEIKGKENIPQGKTFIVASNHHNGLDYWFIGNAFKEIIRNMRFVGALDNFKTLLQSGLLYYFSSAILINRKKEKREGMIKKIIENLENKKIIVIFPEGTTNSKNILLKGKTGVAEVAIKAGVPVIPFGIRNIKNSFKKIVEIGKPMYFSKEIKILNKAQKDKEKYRLFLREITNKIMQEISRLSNKAYTYDN